LVVCALFGVGNICYIPKLYPLALECCSVGPGSWENSAYAGLDGRGRLLLTRPACPQG
jgi:hypothetical protein